MQRSTEVQPYVLTAEKKKAIELQVALWQKKIYKVQRMKNRIAEKKKQLELETDMIYKIKRFFTFEWLCSKKHSIQERKDSERMLKFR